MASEVKLNQIDEVLKDLEYPCSKQVAIDGVGGVTLVYADGDESLADVIGRTNTDYFDSWQDLQTEIFNQLPTEAVGEPGQSEGEG